MDGISYNYDIYIYIYIIWYNTHSILISGNSEGSKKLPDDGRLLQKHVGASIYNKLVVKFSAYYWLFILLLKHLFS
jgi:hypothetical protein